MPWMNVSDLLAQYPDPAFREAFSRLWELKTILTSGVFSSDLSSLGEASESIVLTEAATALVTKVEGTYPIHTEGLANLAAFSLFARESPLVDIERTDIAGVERVVSALISSGAIRFPWVFGTDLYEKFFFSANNETKILSPDSTAELLANTPQGVFQHGRYVTGPLGVLKSQSLRDIPPSRTAPLWHCSDPACEALHTVELTSGAHPLPTYAKAILSALKSGRRESEWPGFWRHASGLNAGYYDVFHPGRLPWLIGTVLGLDELRILAARILDTDGGIIRAALRDQDRSGVLRGSGSKIAAGLDAPSNLQLVLCARDELVIERLEELIDSGNIEIPVTEVRRAKVSRSGGGWLKQYGELSSLGVRFLSPIRNVAVLRLRQMLQVIYQGSDAADLEWVLKQSPGNSFDERLTNYVGALSPRSLVEAHALLGPRTFAASTAFLRYGAFKPPVSSQQTQLLINRIVWKLGFDVQVYPSTQERLRSMMSELATEVARADPRELGKVGWDASDLGFREGAGLLLVWVVQAGG